MKKKEEQISLLDKINFGSIAAENDNLSDYFYSTPVFEEILNGKIDLILGCKGAGKSAIFKTMVDLQGFHKGIEEKYILPISNPNTFIHLGGFEENANFSPSYLWMLWKIYFCILVGKYLIEAPTLDDDVSSLKKQLIGSGFSNEIKQRKSISDYISKIIQSAYMLVRIDGVEYQAGLSPSQEEEKQKSILNIDEIFDLEDEILRNNSKELWILMDKLDEILPGSKSNEELRNSALQSLMIVQSELSKYRNIKVKIFLRSDIYNKLSFENKDHYSDKKVEIKWDEPHLQILLAIRIAACLGKYEPVQSRQFTISQNDAVKYFDMVFDDVYIKKKKIRNIKWMFDSLKDGRGFVSPRDMILLAIKSINLQKDYFNREVYDPRSALISEHALFEGFDEVCRDKLSDYLYGVFPHVQRTFEAFRGITKKKLKIDEVTEYLGNPDRPTLLITLEELCELGALEKVGNKSIERTEEFKIPNIYLEALNK